MSSSKKSPEKKSLFSPLSNSIREFDHVAWPTRKDAIKYLLITIGVITTMTIFLSIIGIAFREGLFTARTEIRSALGIADQAVSSPDSAATQELLNSLMASGVTISTGALSSGTTAVVSSGSLSSSGAR